MAATDKHEKATKADTAPLDGETAAAKPADDQLAMDDQATETQEGFRERLGAEDAADAEEMAEAPIDSDLDYDTSAPEAHDIDYPSM